MTIQKRTATKLQHRLGKSLTLTQTHSNGCQIAFLQHNVQFALQWTVWLKCGVLPIPTFLGLAGSTWYPALGGGSFGSGEAL